MERLETQKESILRHLKERGSITPMEALKLYGSFRLSGQIYKLKRHHDIVTERVFENGVQYARYHYRGEKL